MKIRTILVPLDFSNESRRALAAADALAVAQNADLTLFHVHPIIEVAVLDFTYVQPPEKVDEICEAIAARLRSCAGILATAAERVHAQVVPGGPAPAICAASAHHDLVVMATHGRTGVSHFLLGSVAERVVQGAECSVWVVKDGRRGAAKPDAEPRG